ncbi:MAG: thiol:disulfide interchange protein DsbA/DsbL [Rhodocyclaceae bacterium]|nr:MAG: thiol:disulfide interchange protein DsbA/DsbL [Rhodocyclaceae bacterium]
MVMIPCFLQDISHGGSNLMRQSLLDRRNFLRLAASLTVASTLPDAWAALEPGKQYLPVKRGQPQAANGRTEVLEFFAYTCPHCYHLEATIEPWAKRLPKDVEFRRVPVTFNKAATITAKAFYAAEAMGVLEKIHLSLFAALHDQGLPLTQESPLLDWIAKQGIDRKRFADTMNSFAVQSQLAQATQLMNAYDIDAVPSVVIGGRYLTSVSHTGSEAALPGVMNELIQMTKPGAVKNRS